MRRVMTDDEIASAARLDSYAKARAAGIADTAAKFPPAVVDIVRVLVCELAFRLYLPFNTKFRAGNSEALRELIDACWSSIDANVFFPTPSWVKTQLNIADFDSDDWDQSIASDAGAGLCVFDACLANSASAQDRVGALRCGLEQLFLWETQKMIDHCADSDCVLADLVDSVESGIASISSEQSMVAGLEIAKGDGLYRAQLADWVRQSLSGNFPV